MASSKIRYLCICVALLVCVLCLPASAGASERVSLHTSFSPDRLGASTTIGFGFQIANAEGGLPSPLTGVSLHLPAGINYVTTTLGLAVCPTANLVAEGLGGCPPNSRLGYGSALVEVPFGEGSGHEIPNIQALMGPSHNGNIVVLFYADGREPVYAQLVFQGELVPGSGAFGGNLETAIPLIPSVTNGPPVSILSVQATIGPSHLTYYKHVHGKLVSFHPRGVSVPLSCPHGGFPFSARFSFQDGSTADASSIVACPPKRKVSSSHH
jgi:hypothetical protein